MSTYVTDLNKFDLWQGRYREIVFEIKSWGWHPVYDRCWTYYITVPKNDVLPYYEDIPYYASDYDQPFWVNIHSHGGWTFYQDLGKYVKIGCDYQHLYDTEKIYTVDDVLDDVRKSIDEYIERTDI